MPYLEKNVNFILLFALVIVILGFVGTTVYFQKSLKDVNDKYHEKDSTLQLARNQLQEAINKLLEVNKSYAITSQDLNQSVLDFNQKYTNISGEKKKVDTELGKTKTELKGTKSELQGTKFDLANTQATLMSAQTQLNITWANLTKANTKIINMKSDAGTGESKSIASLSKIDGYLISGGACDIQLQSLQYDIKLIRDKFRDVQAR
jgi:chromosome segregation ATPase